MFNTRLRSLRILRGITQQTMADSLNLSLNAYQKYEQGERSPSLATLVQIADLLNVPTDIILEREDYLRSLGVSVDEYL